MAPTPMPRFFSLRSGYLGGRGGPTKSHHLRGALQLGASHGMINTNSNNLCNREEELIGRVIVVRSVMVVVIGIFVMMI